MKITLYCGDCKTCDMVDNTNKKCGVCNLKIASFKYPNKKQTSYGGDCKSEKMIDIKSKTCVTCKLKNQISIIQMKKKHYIAKIVTTVI